MAKMIQDNQTPPVTPNVDRNSTTENETGALEFPFVGSKTRLSQYEYFTQLFEGEHFQAFSIRVDSPAFSQAYSKLRYVKANLAGLISKVCADMLFSEPIKIRVPDGDQDFVDALVKDNHFLTQLYESALSNSFKGDAVFKLRVGKRNPASVKEKQTIIIEDINPAIYFPEINDFNVRQEPQKVKLAWAFEHASKKYVRIETHEANKVTTKVYEMKGNKLMNEVPIETLNEEGLLAEVETKVDRPLIFHTPNWKAGSSFFGISDYYDLDTLFFAVNNRLTKVDNILDLHSDPILAVPEGILDEKGKVSRDKLKMVQVPEGVAVKDGKPEYVVWDASLTNAFTELEQLLELFFMVSEISPDVLGMGKGQSDSGRALKFKLLRTVAKVARKRLYYDQTIKDLIYYAQVLAKEWGLEVAGVKLKGEPKYPDIEWKDGLPQDMTEAIDNEVKRVDAGLTTTAEAIARLDDIDLDAAEVKAKEIKEENKLDVPAMNTAANANLFAKDSAEPKDDKNKSIKLEE